MNQEYRSYKFAGAKANFLQHYWQFFKANRPLSREGLLYCLTGLSLGMIVFTFCIILIADVNIFYLVSNNTELSSIAGGIYWLVGLIVSLFLLAVLYLISRRLKDIGMSPLWILPLCIIMFIPGINIICLLYLGLKEGVRGLNPYGQRLEQGQAIFWLYYQRNVSLWQNIKAFYLNPRGRLNRLPYFWGNLILLIVNEVENVLVLIPMLMVAFLGGMVNIGDSSTEQLNYGWLILIIALLLIHLFISLMIVIMSLVIQIRRFHDMNYTGWWLLLYLLALIPLVGSLIILGITGICYLKKGTVGNNEYGPDPLAENMEEVN